jgi:hypothetical protein
MDSTVASRSILFSPVFSSLLSSRREAIVLSAAGGLQLGLHLAGLPGWDCPVKTMLGIPCPGCGLTAAIGELINRQFVTSIQTHAFAPIFLFAFVLITVAAVLPSEYGSRIALSVKRLEQHTGITAWVLLLLILYWGFRLFGLV